MRPAIVINSGYIVVALFTLLLPRGNPNTCGSLVAVTHFELTSNCNCDSNYNTIAITITIAPITHLRAMSARFSRK